MAFQCSIQSVSWSRIHLTLTVTLDEVTDTSLLSELMLLDDASIGGTPSHTSSTVSSEVGRGDGGVRFFLRDAERELPVKSVRVDARTHRLQLNVTDFLARAQVPDGTWRVMATVDGQVVDFAGIDLAQVDRLDDVSRVFLYQGNRVAYTVSFYISESDHRPDFLMRTYQFFRPAKKKPPSVLHPVSRFKSKHLTVKRRSMAKNRWYSAARRLNPPKGNTILFASEMRTKLEGNLLAVHDRMVERGLDKQFEFRYSFRIPSKANRRSTLRTIYLLATSDYVLIDDYFQMLEPLNLSRATTIIQLWHAGSGFKAVGYSRFGKYGSPKLQNAHRKYTYCITGSHPSRACLRGGVRHRRGGGRPDGSPAHRHLPRPRTHVPPSSDASSSTTRTWRASGSCSSRRPSAAGASQTLTTTTPRSTSRSSTRRAATTPWCSSRCTTS